LCLCNGYHSQATYKRIVQKYTDNGFNIEVWGVPESINHDYYLLECSNMKVCELSRGIIRENKHRCMSDGAQALSVSTSREQLVAPTKEVHSCRSPSHFSSPNSSVTHECSQSTLSPDLNASPTSGSPIHYLICEWEGFYLGCRERFHPGYVNVKSLFDLICMRSGTVSSVKSIGCVYCQCDYEGMLCLPYRLYMSHTLM
jgi:hypothetical protein